MTNFCIYTNVLSNKTVVKIDDGGKIWFVASSEDNADYQAYLEWVAEGNTAEEWQPEQV